MIALIAMRWSVFKVAIGHGFGVSPDALHVLIGASVFIMWRMFLSPPLDGLAWPLLFAVECGNETLDLLRPPGGPDTGWAASLHDIVLTMLLPTLLAWAWRHRAGTQGTAPESYARER